MGKDEFGNEIKVEPIIWEASGGQISNDGLETSPTRAASLNMLGVRSLRTRDA